MDEKRGEKAFKLNEKVKENENKRRLLLAENAKLLSEIYDEGYYKELLGDEQGEWAGYLGDLEVFYTRSLVNSYVKVYKTLTEKYNLDPETWVGVPITRLTDIVKINPPKEDLPDWLARALTLTSKDWSIEKKKALGQLIEDDEHAHEMVTYEVCKKCGLKKKCNHETDTETAS